MELSADSGTRLGLSWEAPGTCPDFRFSTWEPNPVAGGVGGSELFLHKHTVAPSWVEGGVPANQSTWHREQPYTRGPLCSPRSSHEQSVLSGVRASLGPSPWTVDQ